VPKSLPPFKRRVNFTVPKLQDMITMSVRGITSVPKSISGFPTCLKDLIDQQQLDSPFGTVDHAIAEKPLPVIPSKRAANIEVVGQRKRYQRQVSASNFF
jgi:hypothetical protein